MQSCAGCGGAIGELGKAYAYAGKWCHCVRPIPNDYPHVKGFADIKTKLEDLNPVATPPTEPPVAPAEFVFWLKGYFAAGGPHTFTQGDWKRVAEELQKVRT